MRNPDIDRHLHAMFDAHDAAFAALQRGRAAMKAVITEQSHVSAAIGEAATALSHAYVRMGAAFDAHDEALVLAMRANQSALAVLRAYEDDSTP